MPLMKNASPISHNSPSVPKAFFLATRPKTWIASLSPVLIGFSMASPKNILLFLLTLFFSLFIQIGTNYANDYFDYIKGADTFLRNGPKRATLEGWIAPKTMLLAASILFAAAFVIAIPLMIRAGLWSVFMALFCVACGFLYTAGPKPIGYLGLGELFVFVFFGPIATMGTYFLQTQSLSFSIFIASLAPGLLSCALLIANNLRDIQTDRFAHKKTLQVRFGKTFGAIEYTAVIFLASLVPIYLILFEQAPAKLALCSLLLPLAIPLIKKTFTFQDPLELIPVLQQSSLLLISYTFFYLLFI